MVRKVASAFRTKEKAELAAELARKLAEFKCRPPSGIRNRKGYLAKFLYNKASNWVRDSRLREQRSVNHGGDDLAYLSKMTPNSQEEDLDRRLALERLLWDLCPEDRKLCLLLLQENGNQVNAGRALGIHRNTVRIWLQRIRAAAERHGIRA